MVKSGQMVKVCETWEIYIPIYYNGHIITVLKYMTISSIHIFKAKIKILIISLPYSLFYNMISLLKQSWGAEVGDEPANFLDKTIVGKWLGFWVKTYSMSNIFFFTAKYISNF